VLKKALLLMLATMLVSFTVAAFAEEFIGIGIRLKGYSMSFEDDKGNKSEPKNYYYVVSVLLGGPADHAGIQVGDILFEINGKSLAFVEVEEVVDSIRGPEGSFVSIKIMRSEVDKDGYTQPTIEKTFAIKRQKISMESKKEEK